MMNKEEIQGTWNKSKGKVKQKIASLTNQKVLLEEGKQDQVLGQLQLKLGHTRKKLEKLISKL